MAIIGNIKGYSNEDCIKNMSIGSSGFIRYKELLITQKGVFVSLMAEVLEKKDLSQSEIDDEDIIKIKRIGSSLTEHDFELDFTECKTIFSIESQLYAEDHLIWEEHLVFKDGFNLVKQEDVLPDEAENQPLEDQLQEALNNQDYEKAQEIRDRMANREK